VNFNNDDNQKSLWRDLPLIAPKSVAIVGASQRGADANLAREPRGNRVRFNLKTFGFEGRIVTVNPKYTEVMGYPCYPDIASIPEPVDCLVSRVPTCVCPTLESAAKAGVRAAVVFAAVSAKIGREAESGRRVWTCLKERAFSSADRIATVC
jgi:acyl-CoA synthetase (NDP forming)